MLFWPALLVPFKGRKMPVMFELLPFQETASPVCQGLMPRLALIHIMVELDF